MINFTMDSDFTPLRKYDLIYVGSPYTKYVWGTDAAAYDISKITGRLMLRGLKVFSPIVHSHYVSIASGIDPLDHEFWMGIDESFMWKSDALLICKMSGWEDSYGVSLEIDYFKNNNRPIFSLDPGFVR